MGLEEVMSGEKKDGFTADEIAKEWRDSAEKKESYMMMGIYGPEGTAKSGVALDALTSEEIQEGGKIAVIDVDDSCQKIWEECLGSPVHVRIIDPLITDEEDDVTWVATYNKVSSFLSWFKRNGKKENIKWVILDGLDTFLKWCEFKMKVEFHGGEMAENMEIGLDWGKRNQMYYKVVRLLKSIPANIIVTAHMASNSYYEKDTNGNKVLRTEISGANWHKGKQQDTADELFEIIRMRKHVRKSGIFKTKKYTAEVEKWKGNARMENRKFLVLETKTNTETNENEKIEWHGLIHKLREYNEKDKQSDREKSEKSEPVKDDMDDLLGPSQSDSKELKTKDRKKSDNTPTPSPVIAENDDDDDEDSDDFPEDTSETVSEASIENALDVDLSEELDEESEQEQDEDEEKNDEEKGNEIDTSDDEEWLDDVF
ncbi:hypothetical protein AKJ51_04025 [candidate division MSBL1 archaeon SCGC-AAA382A20]|uniref:Uncharacterized protein n=1 Tax=candidate division MSBL1 archaeon SCGC-AAA382A20 TaxID=1698280 RepID=A0A133VIE7_9EURY|nr:hypothetical protein AKJ51_04025 [candidate division MSBL1 archaeon SCGC-AAA382A20]